MLADEATQLCGIVGGIHLRQLMVNITEGLAKTNKETYYNTYQGLLDILRSLNTKV